MRATRLLLLLSLSSLFPALAYGEVVKGIIDGVYSGSTVKGWACATGSTDSIAYHIYVDGPAGSGELIGSGRASLASGSSIAAECGHTGISGNHRFSYTFTEAQKSAYQGKPIYIHGIRGGTDNRLLTRSGTFAVPAPPVPEPEPEPEPDTFEPGPVISNPSEPDFGPVPYNPEPDTFEPGPVINNPSEPETDQQTSDPSTLITGGGSGSSTWTVANDASVTSIMLWQESEENPLYFKRSDNVWCYIPAGEPTLQAQILSLYTSGRTAEIHCHGQAERLMDDVDPAHRFHRVISR